MRIGAVAAEGIAKKSGEKNSDIAKHTAITNDTRPVRPPCATPAALSTYVVVAETPIHAPAVVAMASARNACLIRAIFPSGPTIPALRQTPTKVPIAPNISIKRNVRTTTTISTVKILSHSNLKAISEIDCGVETIPSQCVIPKGIPIAEVISIPSNMPPLIFFTTSQLVIISPIIARRVFLFVRSPIATKVDSLFTIIPAFCRPMNAMNNPIPALMAVFIVCGIASTIASLILVTVRSMNISPSMNTAVRANCQEQFIPKQTVYTKKAFSPKPGARPNGIFATNDITRVPTIAANAVAVKTAPDGICSRTENIFGFTARI